MSSKLDSKVLFTYAFGIGGDNEKTNHLAI